MHVKMCLRILFLLARLFLFTSSWYQIILLTRLTLFDIYFAYQVVLAVNTNYVYVKYT